MLVCLAPFTGAINSGALETYLLTLKKEPSLAKLPLDHWGAAIHEAREKGLLRPHPVDPAYLAISPALAVILRRRLAGLAQPEMCHAMDTAFRMMYQAGVRSANNWLRSHDPAEVQAGQVFMHLEYDNMLSALEIALARRGSISLLYSLLRDFLGNLGHHSRGLELGERVLAGLDEYGDVITEDGVAERAAVICGIAYQQRELRQHEAADVSYRKALLLYFNSPSAANRNNQWAIAFINHELGLIAYDQRRWEAAEEYLQKSLSIWIEINDPANQAEILVSLGKVAARQGKWPQAMQTYQKAMDLFASIGNRLSQAKACLHLANAASECGPLEEAKQRYRQALMFFVEFGDRAQEAIVHHNLGDIAQDQIQYKRALKHYRKAIRIFYEIGDRANRARSYSRLGALMAAMGQRKMAWQCQGRALKLASMAKDRFTEALTYHELGNLSRRCRMWERATGYYDKAMEIYRAFDDLNRQMGLRLDLGRLAYKQGRWPEGQDHLLAALRQSMGIPDASAHDLALKVVARLWRKNGDASLPNGVAQVLGKTPAEAEAILRNVLGRK